MHILAFILMFIFGSIAAAMDGDFSGLQAIGKVILFIVLFFAVAWIMVTPAALVVVLLLGLTIFAIFKA